MVDIDAIKRRFESLLPTVDERMRRLIAAAESLAIDYGGISIVSRATGVSRRAIARGIVESGNPPVPLGGAIRKPGGGRKSTVEQDATLTVASAVTAMAQFLGQFAHALASPAQRRLRVTTAQRLNQPLQVPHQRRVLFYRALASSAGFADSSAGRHWGDCLIRRYHAQSRAWTLPWHEQRWKYPRNRWRDFPQRQSIGASSHPPWVTNSRNDASTRLYQPLTLVYQF